MKRLILLALLSLGFVSLFAPAAAWAQGASEADAAEFRSIISNQMEALKAGDGGKAFSYASPGIQQKFVNPELFMQMVRSGYPAVVAPRSFEFGTVTDELGRPTQRMTITDATGQAWTALYAFERQPDGRWLISAVILKRVEGADV